MDIIIKKFMGLAILYAMTLGCGINQQPNFTTFKINNITKEDILLFKGVGIDSRLVPNDNQFRFQRRCGKEFCEVNMKQGQTFNRFPSGDIIEVFGSEAIHAKEIVSRFLELKMASITDLTGEHDIVFRRGSNYLYYSEDNRLDVLFSKVSAIRSVERIEGNFFLAKAQE